MFILNLFFDLFINLIFYYKIQLNILYIIKIII